MVYLPYYTAKDSEVIDVSNIALVAQQEHNAEDVNENLKQVELIIEDSISLEDDQELNEAQHPEDKYSHIHIPPIGMYT